MKRLIFLLSLTTAFALVFSTGCNNPTDSDDDTSGGLDDITLSNNSIAENAESGTNVGTLTATGEEGSTTGLVFSIVDGEDEGGAFAISGNSLVTNTEFDYSTKSSYTIRIQVVNEDGGTISKEFTITITEVLSIEALGVYTDRTTTEEGAFDEIYIWTTGETATLSASNDTFEGSSAQLVTDQSIGWHGWQYFNTQGCDLSAYSSGYLHIAIKGDAPDVSLAVGAGDGVLASSYGYTANSGEWHELEIPMSDFSSSIGTVDNVLSFVHADASYSAGSTYIVDDIFFTNDTSQY